MKAVWWIRGGGLTLIWTGPDIRIKRPGSDHEKPDPDPGPIIEKYPDPQPCTQAHGFYSRHFLNKLCLHVK